MIFGRPPTATHSWSGSKNAQPQVSQGWLYIIWAIFSQNIFANVSIQNSGDACKKWTATFSAEKTPKCHSLVLIESGIDNPANSRVWRVYIGVACPHLWAFVLSLSRCERHKSMTNPRIFFRKSTFNSASVPFRSDIHVLMVNSESTQKTESVSLYDR